MTFLKTARSAIVGGAKTLTLAAIGALALTALPELAFAQASGSNPFSKAETAAGEFRDQLISFSLAVGGIGMVACLMLGFFGKLNWKWVATGVGVSFGLVIVPAAINWLAGLAGGSS